jgi:Tfp pilus assembly protein PilX
VSDRHRHRGDAGHAPANGFALVTALFLLVALAGLGVFVATVAGVQHQSTLLSVQGERAHFAARSALEWAFSDIVNNAAGGLSCGPGTVSLSLTEAALSGFGVDVAFARKPGVCDALPVRVGSELTPWRVRQTVDQVKLLIFSLC